jgi:hypothetical protein
MVITVFCVLQINREQMSEEEYLEQQRQQQADLTAEGNRLTDEM